MSKWEGFLARDDFGEWFQTIHLVDAESGVSYPPVIHNKKLYYAVPAGARYSIHVTFSNSDRDMGIFMFIDGFFINRLYHIHKHGRLGRRLTGFPVLTEAGQFEIQSFTTSKRVRSADDNSVESSTHHQGSITLMAFPCEFKARPSSDSVEPMLPRPSGAVYSDEDVKFFEKPSLVTTPGESTGVVVPRSAQKAYPTGPPCEKITVHYETPENLELRLAEARNKRAKQ